MVSVHSSAAWLAGNLPVIAQQGRRLLERLDPAMRARVLAALAGLVILGLGMMALAWLGARMTRRYMTRLDDRQASRRVPAVHDDWASVRLVRDDFHQSENPQRREPPEPD